MSRKEITPRELTLNPFTAIGDDWMLITAGNEKSFNTMTASWGGMGILWNKPVVFCFLRPQRYTLEFVEANDLFTLSIFNHDIYKKELSYCGSRSGRDVDKVKETGLTPLFPDGTVAFDEAHTVLTVRKLYKQDFDPACFIDSSLETNYPQKDYHRMFIGEIVKAYTK